MKMFRKRSPQSHKSASNLNLNPNQDVDDFVHNLKSFINNCDKDTKEENKDEDNRN